MSADEHQNIVSVGAGVLQEAEKLRELSIQDRRTAVLGGTLKLPRTQQRPGNAPEPSPVDCWDWTKAIALRREPESEGSTRRLIQPLGTIGVWGAMP